MAGTAQIGRSTTHLAWANRTVLMVDVVESVRLIEQDESGTVSRWLAFVEHVKTQLITNGRLVKTLGDGMLLEFDDVPSAVAAALRIQDASNHENTEYPPERQILLRMGMEVSDVIVERDDVHGRGVNIASRLTTLAAAGEIVVSQRVRDRLTFALDADLEDLGECFLRHLKKPVRAYRIGPPARAPAFRSFVSSEDLRPSIAVIPFTSHRIAEDNIVLGEFFAEQLIRALSRSPEMNVISRLSTTVFRGRAAGSDDPAVLADALIHTRDGIVGFWTPPGVQPTHLPLDGPDNLIRWEPRVRASIIDFELVSRLGFNSDTATGEMSVQHLDPTPGGGGTFSYEPLVTMIRPDEDMFQKQLVFLDRYADLRGDRASEILSQEQGALVFLASVANLHPNRTPWTLELLAAALRLANFTEMRLKQALSCRRPIEFWPQVQPMILTPGHGTLPMGHATETFMSALVLWNLLRAANAGLPAVTTSPYGDPSWGAQLLSLAARVAVNRIVAGMHFPVDAAAGAVLGLTLGQYFVNRCTLQNNYTAWSFDGTQFPDPTAGNPPPDDGDFYWTDLYDVPNFQQTAPASGYAPGLGQQNLTDPTPPLVNWLWKQALGEWP